MKTKQRFNMQLQTEILQNIQKNDKIRIVDVNIDKRIK